MCKSLIEFTNDILISIGIPSNVVGFQYISKAICLCVENPAYLTSITRDLYPILASIFKTTPTNAERSIRHALNIAWNKDRIVALNKILDIDVYCNNEKPCNSEFIALLASKIPYLHKRHQLRYTITE